MKTVKQEEPVTRSRFIDCPQCKTRNLKLKRIVQAGRCRNCHESYKIIIMFVKTVKKEKAQAPSQAPTVETKETAPESTLPAWEVPSDNSLFGTTSEAPPGFGENAFGWEENTEDNKSETGSEQ